MKYEWWLFLKSTELSVSSQPGWKFVKELFVSTANVLHLRSVSKSWGINIHIGIRKKFCLQFVCYSCGSCYGRWYFCVTKAVRFSCIYCKIWICMQFIFIHMGPFGTFETDLVYVNLCNSHWARSVNF